MKKERNAKEQEGSAFISKSFNGSLGNKTFSTGNGYAFLLVMHDGQLEMTHEEVLSLKKNMLVCFRPHETFSYHTDMMNKEVCSLLWINAEIVKSFFSYLGESGEMIKDICLGSVLPKRCMLPAKDFADLEESFHFFEKNGIQKESTQLKIRLLVPYLFSLISNKTYIEEMDQTPFWLETVCQKMKKQENFVEGISKMVQLSGRTREHLSRSMKKYKATTLSAYINELRLDYAANMLINSEMHVVDLCYESGFSSLDYFGKQFKRKYGMSPSEFRLNMRKNREGL